MAVALSDGGDEISHSRRCPHMQATLSSPAGLAHWAYWSHPGPRQCWWRRAAGAALQQPPRRRVRSCGAERRCTPCSPLPLVAAAESWSPRSNAMHQSIASLAPDWCFNFCTRSRWWRFMVLASRTHVQLVGCGKHSHSLAGQMLISLYSQTMYRDRPSSPQCHVHAHS